MVHMQKKKKALAPPFRGWNDLNWAWNETEKKDLYIQKYNLMLNPQ